MVPNHLICFSFFRSQSEKTKNKKKIKYRCERPFGSSRKSCQITAMEAAAMTQPTRREAILERLGRFPERVPLAAAFGPARDMGDHTRTLVSYDVEEGERIGAWLL